MKTIGLSAAVLAAAVSAQAAAPASGSLLIGDLNVCRETVLGADVVAVPDRGVYVRLTDATQRALHRKTSAIVGQPMALSLGDRLLREIIILEPVDTPRLFLPARSEEEADSILLAATKTCPH
jgi:hypothetical protein